MTQLDKGFTPGCIWIVGAVIGCVLLLKLLSKENPRIQEYNKIIAIAGLAYLSFAAYRISIIATMQAWSDGEIHHLQGVRLYSQLTHGNLSILWDNFSPGNPFYQKLTGLIYCVSGPHPQVMYAIGGGFGFAGILLILDTISRSFRHIPFLSLTLLVGLPSAIFWTPVNLKEGPMLFCIAVVLRSVNLNVQTSQSIALTTLATLIGTALRPHIMFGWFCGVAFSRLFHRFNIKVALTSLLGGSLCLFLVGTLLPGLFVHNFTDTLNEVGLKSSSFAARGGSGIKGTPTPFLTGFSLLLLRPYPWEVFNVTSLAAGLEVWTISCLAFLGWLRCPHKKRVLQHPVVISSIVALVVLSLPFSFFYNMGLLVRQRLQAYPGILVLAIYPHAYRQMVNRSYKRSVSKSKNSYDEDKVLSYS